MKKQLLTLAICFATCLKIFGQENEPSNNYFYTADTVTASATYHMLPGSDKDIIKVDVTTPGVLRVAITNIPIINGFYLDIKFFDSDTTTVISTNSGSNGCWNCPSSTSANALVCNGTYYIWIHENGGQSSANGYNVAITLDTTDACECNNYFSDACIIPINTSFQTKVYGKNLSFADAVNTAGNDVDFYKVYASQPGVMVVGLSNIPVQNQFYLKIQIYASDSTTLIAQNPGSNGCWNCPSSTGIDAVIDTGWYFIKIYDDGYQTSSGAFTMSLNLDTIDSCEYNNYFSTACDVILDSCYKEKIYGLNYTTADSTNTSGIDEDFYFGYTNQPGTLNIAITNIPIVNGFYLLIEVYQPDTITLIASNPNSGCTNCPASISLNAALDTGVYYIRIHENTNQRNSNAFNTCLNFTSSVGINNLDFNSKYNVSPNPSNGKFIIKLSDTPEYIYTLKIRNLIGQEVYEQKLDFKSNEIFIEQPSGVYIGTIYSENESHAFKLILEKN